MKNNPDVIVAGHICLDLIPSFGNRIFNNVENIFRPGALVNVDKMVFSLGGPVANTGIGLEIFGSKVNFLARVGNDQIGQIIIGLLNSYGKTDGITMSSSEASSYTIVLSPQGLDRIFLHHTGTNDSFSSSDVDVDIVKNVKHFHLGYPPLLKKLLNNQGEELALILQKVKNVGVTTSLDMSLPDYNSPPGKTNWKKILKNTLRYVDIFLPSIEEAFYTLYPEEYISMKSEHPKEELISYINPSVYSKIAEEFISLGCKMTALKSGFRGWYFKTSSKNTFNNFGKVKPANFCNWDNRELWCPAFKIKNIASATGSGDASIAGFLSAFIKGYKLEKCLKYANGAGYQNLTMLDAISGLTTWDNLTNLIKTKDVLLFQIDSNNWKWNDEIKMWERKNLK